jgi:hypothetical protein
MEADFLYLVYLTFPLILMNDFQLLGCALQVVVF